MQGKHATKNTPKQPESFFKSWLPSLVASSYPCCPVSKYVSLADGSRRRRPDFCQFQLLHFCIDSTQLSAITSNYPTSNYQLALLAASCTYDLLTTLEGLR